MSKKRPGDRRGEHPASLANLQFFGPGNQAARTHGGYARHFDPELVEQVEATETTDNVVRLESLIRLEQLRLHSALATRARYQATDDYQQTRGVALPVIQHEATPGGSVTKRQRPDFDGAIDRSMGRLLSLIAEQERIAASPAHIADRLTAVLDDAAAAGLDAAGTAEACERAGLVVPFSLQQRVRAELATMEPPEPEGGMTDDELERLSAEYDAQAQGESEWLAERRQQVQEIHKSRDKERNGQ